jgi:hypothetical protein
MYRGFPVRRPTVCSEKTVWESDQVTCGWRPFVFDTHIRRVRLALSDDLLLSLQFFLFYFFIIIIIIIINIIIIIIIIIIFRSDVQSSCDTFANGT